MFSWSQTGTKKPNNNSNGNGNGSNQYPGRRLGSRKSGHTTTTAVAAAAVEGSIRPPSTLLTRAQHLQSYLEDATLQRSTRRVSSDDTTYDTVFQTTQGDTLIVRVNVPLGSSFASFYPAMTLAGVKVDHPWVDRRTMRISGYDVLASETAWKQSGLFLGQAVHAVVQHLQLNPPTILEIIDAGLLAIQPATSKHRTKSPMRSGNHHHSKNDKGSSGGRQQVDQAPPSYDDTLQNNHKEPDLPPPPKIALPMIPREFDDLLAEKSREELESLLQDDLEFMSLIHPLPVSGQLQTLANSRIEENAALADTNLQSEDKLKSLQAEVDQLQTNLQTKVEAFQRLEREQNALCAPPDVSSTLKKLRSAKKEAFDSSEAFAEEWIEDGSADPDRFVKAFLAQRQIHYTRAAKMELLHQHGNSPTVAVGTMASV